MRLLLSCLFIFTISTQIFAQTETEIKLKEEIWKNASPEFKSKEVPEKYKNESAVILAMSMDYTGDYATKMSGLNVLRLYVEKVNIHYRAKLQDKAAVSDYSELSFDKKHVSTNIFGKSSTYSIVAVKIVKMNGTEREVDLTKGVKTDAGSNNDFKIAVPDLEPGDILDYFIALKVENYAVPTFTQNDILDEKYPVVSRIIRYKLPQQITFKNKSYNNAPDFKQVKIEKDIVYTLEDKMHDKAPDILWDYDHRSAPEIRYQVSEKKDIENEKKNAIEALETFNLNYSDIGFIIDYMKVNFKLEKDPKKIAIELFYLLRNPIYMKAYYGTEQGKPLQADPAPEKFFYIMSKYLTKYKIPHEIMIVPGRHFGPFESLVNLSSCDLVLKVNTTPALYFPRPKPFSIPNELDYLFEGMPKVSKRFAQEGGGIDDKPMEITKAEDNVTNTNLLLTLNADDKSKLNVQRAVEVKGHNKEYHQFLIFTNYDYLKEYDQPKYQVQSSSLLKGIIKEYNTEKVKFEQRLTQDYNERDKRIQEELESEMDVKIADYKNLAVKNVGMWHVSPDTKYTDEFIIENLTKKAGPNIIVEIGKLIEKQTLIKEEQKVRTRDVYMSYPRTYAYEMTLIIPEGYTVEGIELLNKKIENETGGFVSTAQIEGKSLVIKTKK